VVTLARIPTTAADIVLMLHVVAGLGRGYGAAGLVTAAFTIGAAIGGPWRGRAVDKLGVRRALVPSILVEAVFWAGSPWLPYELLLPGAVLVGIFSLPVFGLTRQSISVMVAEEDRRTAFALDSITVEISFMAGPLVGVIAATQFSTETAMLTIGTMQVLAGLLLFWLNPPVRSEGTQTLSGGRRSWFTPRFLGVLVLMAASTVALAGTDVSSVALLRGHDQTQLIGFIYVAWGVGSILGGLVYGGLRRAVSSAGIVLGLGVLTVPLGLASSWWLLALAIIPAGALCAPSVAATVSDVSKLVPEARLGEAMGWHGTAGTIGIAIGAPLSGLAIDQAGPSWGFVVAGGASCVLAMVALVAARLFARKEVSSDVDHAAALEGSPEGDLVGVLEITTDRKSAGQPGDGQPHRLDQ
jgi:MFS family permease